ncbi:unnamed protein product [Caenorhabditis auriculariae]|uniref:Major facilitator superfamily (MFS) profile domain-containing protein n=1 Tax=Caenorhabditis auriculariae TaxID=2777116 RepID=A0A8S1H2Y8_9PELO|nr:unnamed protein product [Caenorhabditis auriculariae]
MSPLPLTGISSWNSIYISGCCAFIQATQFSIFFSSMWPYLLKLKPDVRQDSFGVVVSAYSFAQCIGSPFFGYWSNKIGQVRIPLIFGYLIMAAGNITYLSLQFLPSYHLQMMMLARFIAGAGTGNMSLLRAYVSTASTSTDRSRALACVSGGIAVGTMIGPGMQLLFTPLGEKGVDFVLNLNIYTAPALFSLGLNIVGLVFVKFWFVEHTVIQVEASKIDGEVETKLPDPNIVALMVCILTRFTQIFVQTSIETLGSAYSMMMFGFEKEQAVSVNAGVHMAAGTIAALFYVFFILFNPKKFIRVRSFCALSLFFMLLMFIATYSYPFLGEKVHLSSNASDADCNREKYQWCDSLTTTPVWVYYSGYVLVFGIANSFLNISLTTLYSKVVGPRPQGTHQGFFQMSGSIGRLIAPLLMSWLLCCIRTQNPMDHQNERCYSHAVFMVHIPQEHDSIREKSVITKDHN